MLIFVRQDVLGGGLFFYGGMKVLVLLNLHMALSERHRRSERSILVSTASLYRVILPVQKKRYTREASLDIQIRVDPFSPMIGSTR